MLKRLPAAFRAIARARLRLKSERRCPQSRHDDEPGAPPAASIFASTGRARVPDRRPGAAAAALTSPSWKSSSELNAATEPGTRCIQRSAAFAWRRLFSSATPPASFLAKLEIHCQWQELEASRTRPRTKPVLKLVAKPREWSCSYGQLNLFVDACGAVLVGLAEGRYGLDHPLPFVDMAKATNCDLGELDAFNKAGFGLKGRMEPNGALDFNTTA